jgi:hypothetical protein
MIFPLIVTIIAFAFAAILLRQFWSRRRPYQLVWTVSLTLGGVAGVAFILFLAAGRNAVFFKTYYAAGALLMAAYLGLGSIYLLAPRRFANYVAAVLVVLSVVGIALIYGTSISTSQLHAPNIEAGTNLVSGAPVVLIAVLNTFGAVSVIGGALYSAWRVWRRQGPVRILASNALIATGTILASLAGTLARLTGNGSAFWALLAAGFVVLFSGFILTTMSGRSRTEQVQKAASRPETA